MQTTSATHRALFALVLWLPGTAAHAEPSAADLTRSARARSPLQLEDLSVQLRLVTTEEAYSERALERGS